MTDCFFVSVRSSELPEALKLLQDAIMKDVQTYRMRLVEINKEWYSHTIDKFITFDIQSYTVIPEMMSVRRSGIATLPDSQPQFVPVYTTVALVIVSVTKEFIPGAYKTNVRGIE